MIIVFEGVDGSGKGEICKGLAISLHAVAYSTPPGSFREVREFADKHMTAPEHYEFYLQSVRQASRELSALAQNGQIVLVDRYWMTTVAYHRADGVDAKLADFGPIVLPDFTVFLDVSPERQLERLAKRGMSEGDKRDFGNLQAVRKEYQSLLLSVQPRYHIIDTTNLTIGQVVAATAPKILNLAPA